MLLTNDSIQTLSFTSKQSLYCTIKFEKYKSQTFLLKKQTIEIAKWGTFEVINQTNLSGD